MKSDFLIAITQIAAEKNLPKEVVLQAVETALISAYKKDSEATATSSSASIGTRGTCTSSPRRQWWRR